MTIDLLDQERLRSGNPQPTLAQLLEKSELRVLPLSAHQRDASSAKLGAFLEPSIVWHPDAPDLALVVNGGSKWNSSFEFAFDEIPGRRFSAACGCLDCFASFDPTIPEGDGSRSSAALFGAIARVVMAAEEGDASVPSFRGVALDNDGFASLCGLSGGGQMGSCSFTDLNCSERTKLLSPWGIGAFVKSFSLSTGPLARHVQLWEGSSQLAIS